MNRYILVFAWLPILILAACGSNADETGSSGEEESVVEENVEDGVPEVPVMEEETPIVTMEMESGGIVKIELYPEHAPITVNNFVSLIDDQFYDGLSFHRVIEGFMIQGGDPLGNGSGGPGYTITGEFSQNDVDNELSHERGIISMARSQDYNSAGSQFFIMHEDNLDLDNQYAAFGKVIEGMDVVDEIAAVETTEATSPFAGDGDHPVEGQEQTIQAMTVER